MKNLGSITEPKDIVTKEYLEEYVSENATGGSGTDVLEGEVRDLLWTNPNPSSEFAAQTISGLSLSEYDLFVIVHKTIDSAGDEYITSDMCVKGSYNKLRFAGFIMSDTVAQRSPNATRSCVIYDDRIIFLGANKTLYSSNFSTMVDNKTCIPYQVYGIRKKKIATGIDASALVDLIYPVGSIYMSVNSANPATLFGGTWEQWGMGRTLIGVGANEENTFSEHGSAAAGYVNHSKAEIKGGEYTHLLSVSEMPSHAHTADGNLTAASAGAHTHQYGYYADRAANGTARNTPGSPAGGDGTYNTSSSGAHTHDITGSTNSVGGGGAHNNMQPYITCYMWKRTA